MRYYNVTQGEEEWYNLRKGVLTASRCNQIITPKTGKLSAQADALIAELVGEQLSMIPPEGVENYTNRAMRWGQICEGEARAFIAMHHNYDPQNGGFCMSDDGRFGCSPDYLVGLEIDTFAKDGKGRGYDFATAKIAGEIKCVQAATQVRYLLDEKLPNEHRWQAHMHLIVTKVDFVDWTSYVPGLAPLVVRVEPGPDTEQLRVALEEFHAKYVKTLQRVREMA